MMSSKDEHNSFLLEVLNGMKETGYEVIVEPQNNLLPSFLQDVYPDAIAKKGDHWLLIEVKTRASVSGEKSLERLRKAIEGQPNWELRVFYHTNNPSSERLTVKDEATINRVIDQANSLVDTGNLQPALLLYWSAFEAIARTLYPRDFSKPQSPARLIEVLTTRGDLHQEHATELRELAYQRNRFIHGDLDVQPSRQSLIEFREILVTLVANKKSN